MSRTHPPLYVADVRGVQVRYWYPAKPLVKGRLGRRLPLRRRLSNFGDLLGPLLVRRLVESRGLAGGAGGLVSVGSVLHLVQAGDAVWGTGVNGKSLARAEQAPLVTLDVHAVRGPLTADLLERSTGRRPSVFGDPGVLVRDLLPEVGAAAEHKDRAVTVVPNVNDLPRFLRHPHLLDPRRPVMECLLTIARSEAVVASSLHGLVIAEALGVPTALFAPGAEDLFKYRDYYLGIGVEDFPVHPDADRAARVVRGGAGLRVPPPDTASLLDAFPRELWGAAA